MSNSHQISQMEKIFLSFKVIYLYCILKIGKFVHSYTLDIKIGLTLLLTIVLTFYLMFMDNGSIENFNIYLYWFINTCILFMMVFGNNWLAKKITETLVAKISTNEEKEQNIKNLTMETVAKIEQKKILDTIHPVLSSNRSTIKKVYKI